MTHDKPLLTLVSLPYLTSMPRLSQYLKIDDYAAVDLAYQVFRYGLGTTQLL